MLTVIGRENTDIYNTIPGATTATVQYDVEIVSTDNAGGYVTARAAKPLTITCVLDSPPPCPALPTLVHGDGTDDISISARPGGLDGKVLLKLGVTPNITWWKAAKLEMDPRSGTA